MDNFHVVIHADFDGRFDQNLHKTNQDNLQTLFVFWFVSTVSALVPVLSATTVPCCRTRLISPPFSRTLRKFCAFSDENNAKSDEYDTESDENNAESDEYDAESDEYDAESDEYDAESDEYDAESDEY
ncbi:MAG: hypothetical protein LBI18_15050, partial [Planctomycetaceae bacterium]|nr:hypothetical protein [Planctomycetaceae bacterium]